MRKTAGVFLGVFAILAATLAANLLIDGGRGTAALQSHLPTLDRLATLAGFGIDEVVLTGQRFTHDGDVFDALELPSVRSILNFDGSAARRRIEQLPWVATAAITRVYPGRIDIRVTERTAYAVWLDGARAFLVDVGGRILSPVRMPEVLNLPRITGAGAPAEAASLYALLERYPAIQQRLELAERVGGRRWTLHMKDNVALHLPADREASALEHVAAGAAVLFAAKDIVVDLRSATRVAVRPAPAARQRAVAGGF